MKKINLKWSIEHLIKTYKAIEFPEFQREPTVWGLDKKRKLIDSILRDFDIASIYLFKRPDGIYECIDGRQRINTIISFLGLNEDHQDNSFGDYNNNFKFISSDELLGSDLLKDFDNKIFEQFNPAQRKKILQYQFNVIEIAELNNDGEELNLMFLRLQLGAPLNAGEKLNAMVGDMKDFIFHKLGKNKYIHFLNIPKRRFARELIAAQIAINFFSLNEKKGYERARFIDLQEFFKEHLKFNPNDKKLATLLEERLNDVYKHVSTTSSLILKNKAIGLSVFFFIVYLILNQKEKQIKQFIKFLNEFLKRLKNQVAKGIDIDKEYRDLLKFQTYISQAAVEKYAIENRQKFLEEYFNYYVENEKIIGDK
ncbi:MAG TPA: DUF262 domain-containing protein [Ignavibacteria bacterium]